MGGGQERRGAEEGVTASACSPRRGAAGKFGLGCFDWEGPLEGEA